MASRAGSFLNVLGWGTVVPSSWELCEGEQCLLDASLGANPQHRGICVDSAGTVLCITYSVGTVVPSSWELCEGGSRLVRVWFPGHQALCCPAQHWMPGKAYVSSPWSAWFVSCSPEVPLAEAWQRTPSTHKESAQMGAVPVAMPPGI